MDYFDQKLSRSVEVLMIDPHNLDAVLGNLDGVDFSGSSVSAAYYTDTRTSAKLSVVGDGWVPGSLLRIVAHIGEETRTLGTYWVYDDDAKRSGETWQYSYSLQSALYRISKDRGAGAWIIKGGVKAMTAAAQDLDWAGAEYVIEGNDALINEPIVFDGGKNRLEHLMALCTMADNRCDVSPDGRITVEAYKEPSEQEPSFTLDLADHRGVISDGISRASDRYSMPNRIVVSFTANNGSEQTEITGYADISGNLSPQNSGRVITDYMVVDSLNPPTSATAFDLAKQYADERKPALEWDIKTAYLPIWEGDVIALIVHDGAYTGRRVCLVKNVDIRLDDLSMSLKLKELFYD